MTFLSQKNTGRSISMPPSLCSLWNPRLQKWPFTPSMQRSCWWRTLRPQTWKCASTMVSQKCMFPLSERIKSLDFECKTNVLCRSKDPQDVGADTSGGEEWEVVHSEGRSGAEWPEPREPAICGAVRRRPRHVFVSGGGHHSRGAAQQQEHPFLPHNHRQVRRAECCRLMFVFLSPRLVWLMFIWFASPSPLRRPANPNSPCSASLPAHPAPPEAASPPQAPQITPSVSVSQPCTS